MLARILPVLFTIALCLSLGACKSGSSDLTLEASAKADDFDKENPALGNLKISQISSDFKVAGKPNFVVDSYGQVFYPDDNGLIWKIDASGLETLFAGNVACIPNCMIMDGIGANATFLRPYSLAIDSQDQIFVLDSGAKWIRKITPDGTVSTTNAPLFANHVFCLGFTIDSKGNFYCTKTQPGDWISAHSISRISPDGTTTDFAGTRIAGFADGAGSDASFYHPTSLTTDASDNVYVLDSGNYAIRKISPSGVVTTLAGDGTPGIFTFWNGHGYISADATGSVFDADNQQDIGFIRKISPDGQISKYCGNSLSDSINTPTHCNRTGLWVNTGLVVSKSGSVFYGAGNDLFKISRPHD